MGVKGRNVLLAPYSTQIAAIAGTFGEDCSIRRVGYKALSRKCPAGSVEVTDKLLNYNTISYPSIWFNTSYSKVPPHHLSFLTPPTPKTFSDCEGGHTYTPIHLNIAYSTGGAAHA